MSLLPRGRRARRLLPLGALVALAATLAPVAFGADAPPDPLRTRCAGSVAAVKGDFNSVAYRFGCRGAIKSYTMVSSETLLGAEGAPDIFVGSTKSFADPKTDILSCEGDIPSYGFICAGSVTGKNTIASLYEPETQPCSPEGKWTARTFLVVTAPDGTQSGPFRMGFPKTCKPEKPAARKR